MKIYRIHGNGETLGAVAALYEDAAQAYALGKYGAGANVLEVDVESALEAGPVCIIISTVERHVNQLSTSKKIRTLLP